MKGKGKEKEKEQDDLPVVSRIEQTNNTSLTINSGLQEFNVLVENTRHEELAKHRSGNCTIL